MCVEGNYKRQRKGKRGKGGGKKEKEGIKKRREGKEGKVKTAKIFYTLYIVRTPVSSANFFC
jgi:hypothetical protein